MQISAIILAGGLGTRMGGVDKGLLRLQNKVLISHVIDRLTLQVNEVIINANRSLQQYQSFGLKIVQDETDEFLGPLSGFLLGLKHAQYDLVLTVPCDSPLLPSDLATRLYNALEQSSADIAFACSDDNTHPVFCLMRKSVLSSLISFLEQGERKVSAWQKNLNYIEVDFSDTSHAFTNLNTLDDLKKLEAQLLEK